MDPYLSDHALFPHLTLTCLKLRLNQTYHPPSRFQQLPGRNQYFCQGDKRHIRADKVKLFSYILPHNISEICLLLIHYSGILQQLLCQLTVPNVHGVHFTSSVLQHTVRKTACGSAHIHTNHSLKSQLPHLHCPFQLQSSPAHIRRRLLTHFYLYLIRLVKSSRFGLFSSVHMDVSRTNHFLGLFPGQRISLPHQNNVQPFSHIFTSPTSAAPSQSPIFIPFLRTCTLF